VIVVLLKIVHVVGIATWSAGLLVMPFLFLQRRDLEGYRLHDLHNFTRFLYITFASPGAYLAVASGITLIFLQATFVPWFSIKLALVAMLVVIHLLVGLAIMRLFEPEQSYPRLRAIAVSIVTIGIIGAILATVLGKPDIAGHAAVEDFFAPGALAEMLSGITAWWK
jgi:putative membrane protein